MRGVIGSEAIRRAVVLAIAPVLAIGAIDLLSRDAASSPPEKSDAAPDVAKPDAGKSDAADAKSPYNPDALPWDAGKKPDALPPMPDARPIPPDPVPLAADAVFILTMRFHKGKITLEKVRHEKLPKKGTLPRHFGRFAAELYVGPTLLERLRFDFPLITDDLVGDAYEKGLDVSIDVKVPDSERPTRLEIWDRATDRRFTFPYPPK